MAQVVESLIYELPRCKAVLDRRKRAVHLIARAIDLRQDFLGPLVAVGAVLQMFAVRLHFTCSFASLASRCRDARVRSGVRLSAFICLRPRDSKMYPMTITTSPTMS